MTRLENWTLHSTADKNGKPIQFLTGKVFGHPKADYFKNHLTDGHKVRTSRIVDIDFNNNIAVSQSGTVYELGRKMI